MSATSHAMNKIATNLVRLAHRPGLLLLGAAGVPATVFVILAFIVGRDSVTWTGWLLFVVAAACVAPPVTLAVGRERLRRTTGGLGQHGTVVPGGTVVVAGPEGEDPGQAALKAEMGTWSEAVAEGRIRTARWLPRLEATQRAFIRAAGGVVNAPYLRDDLRVTLLATLGTVAVIPLATLGAFVAAFVLLLG